MGRRTGDVLIAGGGLRDVTALMLGAALGYGGSLAFGPPPERAAAPPRAQLHCAPLVVRVGQPVHCVDLSTRAGARLFGPDGEIALAGGAATPVFATPGDATLRLRLPGATDAPADASANAQAAVVVIAVSPRRPIAPSIGLILDVPRGEAPAAAHDVMEALAVGGPDLQTFEQRWPAEPGFTIRRIRLQNMHSRGLAGLQFRVVEDGAAATLSFSLRRGDERAYLNARIVLDHAPAPGGAFGPTLWLDVEGVWRLPATPGVDAQTATLIDAEGGPTISVPIGGTTVLRNGAYALSIDRASAGLRLDVRANVTP